MRCAACALSWATWLLFTGVHARHVVLRVRCPGPLASCSLVHLLGAWCCLCVVLGHLAPVHHNARSVRCVAYAVSWATWLLFSGVLARCFALRVWCPGPLGSCSPLCTLGPLCCVCGVLGHLAPVHQCAHSVCCLACAVSQATWLLFDGPYVRCVLSLVRCPGPVGSCSPVCSLGVLCCVRGVLGQLAPVHRRARSVCCAVCCVCGVLSHLAPVHRCARWVCCVACAGRRCGGRTRQSRQRLFVAGRGWVPSGRAHIHQDGGSYVAGRGCVRCLLRTRPPRRQLFSSQQGLGSLLGAHTSIWTAAGVAWHLFSCRGPFRVVHAFWVRSTRRPLLLGTCPCPLIVAGSVPRGPEWCAAPRPVRSLSVLRSAFLTPWCLSPPRGLSPLYLPGGSARRAEAGREPGTWCLPLSPAEAGAPGTLRVVPVCGPAMVLSLAGPSSVSPWLRALRWFACVDPVTDASGFPYRPSFELGLGRCTGAVSCGRRHLPGTVAGRHARVQCVSACARPSWPARAGCLPERLLVCPTIPLAALSFCSGRPSQVWGCPLRVLLLAFFLFYVVFSPFPPMRPLCLLLSLVWDLGVLGLGAVWTLPPPALCFFSSFLPQLAWFGVCFPPPSFCPSRPLYFLCGLLCPPSPPLFGLWISCCSAPCVLPLLWYFPPGLWLLPCSCAPPLVCVSRLSSLPLVVLFFSSAALFLPACLAFVGGSRHLLPPPPPRCGRCALCCLVLPRCAALPSGVLRCRVAVFCPAYRAVVPRLASPWAAARCAVFFGAAFCVLCCSVGCCCVFCRLSGSAVRLRCLRCALPSGFGLRYRVPCCAGLCH